MNRRFKGASELVKFQKAHGKTVNLRMEMTFREGALMSKQYAYDLLSGIWREPDLRRAGHPYGRYALMPFKPLPINVQTGQLRNDLEFTWSHRQGVTTYRIWNSAPHSVFILSPTGTVNMVARPFWKALDQYYSDQVHNRLLKTFAELHQ